MFKDYDNYLSASLKVYMFLLVIIFIMKLVGLNYFGLDIANPIIVKINDFCINYHLTNLWYLITLFIYTQVIASIGINRKLKTIETAIITSISLMIFIFVKPNLNPMTSTLLDYFYLLIVIIILNRFKDVKSIIKRYTIVVIVNVIFQMISLFIRNIGHNEMYYDNFIVGILMNIDYILLSIIMYKIYFMKGDIKLCGEAISFLQMKKRFTLLLKKLQKQSREFKKLNDEEKYTIVVYFILSLIWNIFTVMVVLFVANMNETIIECIFILISFWISKKIFGKAFHLKSMIQCFIVSNLTYYVLNRITTPIGISILIPIMLGTGLAYVTSKLVKKTYKPLYKGMSKEEFDNSILKVTDKDSLKYNICYDYFIERENAVFLGRRYNYTESGIRKITSRVNEKIKALN